MNLPSLTRQSHRSMIHVFKTDVNTTEKAKLLPRLLNLQLHKGNWNLDREDCDCILRIDSTSLQSQEIIQLLMTNGFSCTELE